MAEKVPICEGCGLKTTECSCEPLTFCDQCNCPLFLYNYNAEKCPKCGQPPTLYNQNRDLGEEITTGEAKQE